MASSPKPQMQPAVIIEPEVFEVSLPEPSLLSERKGGGGGGGGNGGGGGGGDSGGPSPSPQRGLLEFVNEFSDDRAGEFLPDIGPIGDALFSVIGNEGVTASILATNFWRAWLSSTNSGNLLYQNGGSSFLISDYRTIIVPRPELQRFDLIALDPGLPSDVSPVHIDLSPVSEDELYEGSLNSSSDSPISQLGENGPAAMRESFRDGVQPFAVVLAPLPASERLYAPDRALEVDGSTPQTTSTAGVVVKDCKNSSRVGVTGALHGVDTSLSSVDVDGVSGTIVRTHSITDSVFIEVPDPCCSSIGKNGVMNGIAPRGNQNAEFVGATSRNRTTTITGWDPQVPTPSSNRQALVYTGRDAQPGDSGCALVSDDDWVVGFAFERTKPGQSPAQCSWVWAQSVLDGLDVELV